MAGTPKLPSPRPWWWLATSAAQEARAEFIACPWCGAPAETVAWHASSSLLDGAEAGGARVGSAFIRAICVFGHWFLAPAGPADPRIAPVPAHSPRGTACDR